MDNNRMIPQDIWEKDCKYCTFRSGEENFEYGSRGANEQPCKIGKYKGNCRIWNEKTKKFDLTEHEAHKDHCPSCRPCEGFGICGTCEYFNGFHDNVEDKNAIYCTLIDGPVNRRNSMPHINAGYGKEITHWNYVYFTCDRYKVDGYWKNTLKKQALEGRIPKNFNPDTFEPLEYIEGVPIEVWEAEQQEYENNKPENVKKRKLQDAIRQRMKKTEVTDDSSN